MRIRRYVFVSKIKNVGGRIISIEHPTVFMCVCVCICVCICMCVYHEHVCYTTRLDVCVCVYPAMWGSCKNPLARTLNKSKSRIASLKKLPILVVFSLPNTVCEGVSE